jgi:hypothetical protein
MMAALIGLTAPAAALSDAECSKLIERPDVYASGTLFDPYRKALVASGRAVFENGRVGRITVMIGCSSGAFDDIKTQVTTGLPSSGEAKSKKALDHNAAIKAK